jgi:hypothetical protein
VFWKYTNRVWEELNVIVLQERHHDTCGREIKGIARGNTLSCWKHGYMFRLKLFPFVENVHKNTAALLQFLKEGAKMFFL